MWNVLAISKDLYGFQADQAYHEPWTAVVDVAVKARCLEVRANVYPYELQSGEQYEELLAAIRQFTWTQAAQKGVSGYFIHYTCRGLINPEASIPLPTAAHPSGYLQVDAVFEEKASISEALA